MNREKKIFVLDDEPRVAKAIAQSVLSLPEVVVECYSNPFECLEVLKINPCDVLITDINMPQMNGIAVLKATKELAPFIKVVIVTGHGDIQMAVQAVKMGAAHFFEKPLSERTFLPVLKEIVESLASQDDARSLTAAETQVLKLVADGKANKEIAFLLKKSLRTIENQRHSLMKKLNADSPAELTKKAISMGLSSV